MASASHTNAHLRHSSLDPKPALGPVYKHTQGTVTDPTGKAVGYRPHTDSIYMRPQRKRPEADKNKHAKHELRPGRKVLRGPSLLPWVVVRLASALPWERPPPLIR